jgi:hypothetical protein
MLVDKTFEEIKKELHDQYKEEQRLLYMFLALPKTLTPESEAKIMKHLENLARAVKELE